MPTNITPAWLVPYLSMLGLYVSGDIDNTTIYTTKKGRIVAFPKSPPCKPPTYLQLQCRSRFRAAQAQWSAKSKAEKIAWENATRRLKLDLTGQNAYMSLALSPDNDSFNRLNAAVQGALTLPTPIPQ